MRNGLYNAPLPAPTVDTRLRDKPAVRIIPYDYVASFKLRGAVGNVIEDVINISVDGTFVAVAVGYGLEANTAKKIELVVLPPPFGETLLDMTLVNIPPHVLMDGFRFNPALEQLAFPNGQLDTGLDVNLANAKGLFQHIRPLGKIVENFNFLFSIIDTGSGRELQNAPIHSIAGLGQPNGKRPFRMLAKPLAFLPRSSVRLQIEERSEGVTGRLFIVLHGYKILGAAGVSEEQLRALSYQAMQHFGTPAASTRTIQQVEQRALPSTRVLPFDYVGTLDLKGVGGNIVETEININVEGGFVATSLSYSLAVEDTTVDVNDLVPDAAGFVKLGDIKLTQFSSDVLKEGFRIQPNFRRLAFANGKLTKLPTSTVKVLFERLNPPENVNFLYSIIDTGTGREWQNEPVHNVAGLGIANGARPFRNLAWPMYFLPRSAIRLRVEEIFGRGRLFVVFQGYKILGAT